jgi:hypothetical protein
MILMEGEFDKMTSVIVGLFHGHGHEFAVDGVETPHAG